jgi:hypothetical protein
MNKSAQMLIGVVGLGCFIGASSVVNAEEVAPSQPLLEMDWGNLENPSDSGGFGMRVTLQADGQLSCQYAFTEGYMGFSGTTASVGKVAPGTLRYLERVFTDAQYLVLPSTMPGGTLESQRAEFQLTTSFGKFKKQTRLVSGDIKSEAENDRLMKAIDTVFNTCPTRPLTPIED